MLSNIGYVCVWNLFLWFFNIRFVYTFWISAASSSFEQTGNKAMV